MLCCERDQFALHPAAAGAEPGVRKLRREMGMVQSWASGVRGKDRMRK